MFLHAQCACEFSQGTPLHLFFQKLIRTYMLVCYLGWGSFYNSFCLFAFFPPSHPYSRANGSLLWLHTLDEAKFQTFYFAGYPQLYLFIFLQNLKT